MALRYDNSGSSSVSLRPCSCRAFLFTNVTWPCALVATSPACTCAMIAFTNSYICCCCFFFSTKISFIFLPSSLLPFPFPLPFIPQRSEDSRHRWRARTRPDTCRLISCHGLLRLPNTLRGSRGCAWVIGPLVSHASPVRRIPCSFDLN
jgi:hypothetical protein